MANESLYVNGLGTERTAWTEVGTPPFLNAQDQPDHYIYTTIKKAEHGDFTFTDSGGSGTINSVTLYVYAKNAAGRDLAVFIHDGTSWYEYAVSPPISWDWVNVAIPVLDSWTKIDGAKLYIMNANKTDRMDVDAAYLYVDYTAAAQEKSKTVTGDLRIAQRVPKTITGDLYLKEEDKSKTVTGDLYVKEEDKSKTVTGDLILINQFTKTVTGDLILKGVDVQKTVTGDLYLLEEDKSKTVTGDLILLLTGTKTVTGDLYLKGEDQIKTVTGDLIVGTIGAQEKSKTVTGDLILQKQDNIKTITGDLILWSGALKYDQNAYLFTRGGALYTQKEKMFTRRS